ncbi:hypothetical protein BVY04_04410, partial [bacterium M21]
GPIGIFSTLRCLEQIRNDASYHDANVKVVSIGGGFSYGPLGISHHATEDLAILRAIPGMTVLSPTTLWETVEATKALVETPGTCYFRLDKSHGKDPMENQQPFRIGKARVLQQGTDCTFIVTGGILEEVQHAVAKLQEHDISSRILSMHTICPIDKQAILDAAQDTGGVITVEEHVKNGGLGSAVAEVLMDANVMPKHFLRMGLGSNFSSIVGSQSYLRERYGISSSQIAIAAETLLRKGD